MKASRVWQGIISRIATVAKDVAVKLHRWRARGATPAMIGTPPSRRSMWHDPAQHARDFAERYAEPMNYHATEARSERLTASSLITLRGPGIPRLMIGTTRLKLHYSTNV